MFGLTCLRRAVCVNGEIDRALLSKRAMEFSRQCSAKERQGRCSLSDLATWPLMVSRCSDTTAFYTVAPIKIKTVDSGPVINVQNGNRNNLFSKEESECGSFGRTDGGGEGGSRSFRGWFAFEFCVKCERACVTRCPWTRAHTRTHMNPDCVTHMNPTVLQQWRVKLPSGVKSVTTYNFYVHHPPLSTIPSSPSAVSSFFWL